MLLTARAYAEGGRALAMFTALMIDKMVSADDAAQRKASEDLVALLTPIVKAFITDNGWIATSACLQVLGGHGYIREWGMEQFLRDARINMIYEGTNTIQALDFLGRKTLSDGGAKLKHLGRLIQEFIEEEGVNEAMQEFINPLADLGDKVNKLTAELGMRAMQNPEEVGAAAVDYLRVAGHMVMGYLWARMARIALAKEGSGDPFYTAKLATARFYFAKLLPETAGLIRSARAGVKPLAAMPDALF
jgi:alkylation response protein AidB-like acyl-CoA dehydrogenase